MICLICRQAEIVDGSIAVHFERGEMRLTMNNDPAQICPSCGEAYVAEDVAAKLLREAEKEDTLRSLFSTDFSSFSAIDFARFDPLARIGLAIALSKIVRFPFTASEPTTSFNRDSVVRQRAK